jgi:hypothetical protein
MLSGIEGVFPATFGLVPNSTDSPGDLSMKLINPKVAATACLFGMLAAPAVVFAGHRTPPPPPPFFPKPTPIARVAEPSTLVMILAGMGLGIGLAVVGLRRSRSVTA